MNRKTPDHLSEYSGSVANWRQTLRANNFKTRLVIGSYLLIYVAIGLLFDLYWYTSHYHTEGLSLSALLWMLITFQLFPKITLITLGIAVVSLLVAFKFHDRLMLLGTEYFEITPENARSTAERQLYNVVEEMKVAAGLQFMPRVFLIEADYMNAFASGYSEKSALVAITRGLMEKLNRDELQAVMAHELSHVRHLDIKLTLFASVLSNLMLMMVDFLFYSMLFNGRSSDDSEENRGRGNQLYFIILLLRYLLPLVTVFLTLYLSRLREFMADAGAVELMRDNEPMARALLKIKNDHESHQQEYADTYHNTAHESVRRAAYIFDPVQAGIEARSALSDFFSTHPSVERRLRALGFNKK